LGMCQSLLSKSKPGYNHSHQVRVLRTLDAKPFGFCAPVLSVIAA
jgi:hypothetical protein